MNHFKVEAAVRALLLNVVLDTLKAAKSTLTYSEAANIVGVQARSGTFFELLMQTLESDFASGSLPRCALIVSKKEGRPAPAFFEKARAVGYDVEDNDRFLANVMSLFGVAQK
jgi:hypothetical protein